MAYARIISHGEQYTGEDFGRQPVFLDSPYNFLAEDPQLFFKTKVPCALSMISFDPEADNSYLMTFIAADFYLSIKLNHDEYKELSRRPQHMHNTYEIVYVQEGTLFQQIEARRYQFSKRSCCILNRNIRHTEEYDHPFRTVTLSLAADFLSELFSDPYDGFFSETASDWQSRRDLKSFFSPDTAETDLYRKTYLSFVPAYDIMEENDRIHDLFEQMTNCIISPEPGCSFFMRSLICRLLDCLSNRELYSTDLISLGTKAESEAFSNITRLMLETHGRISRSELQKRLNYSGQYLNRISQKFTGMSLFKYGNYFTMKRAAWLLINSDATVSEIAAELGFSDRTHFYGLFRKEYRVTPKQYRERYRQK